MKWYKYLEAKHAKQMVENGTLRLGALSSYQNVEQLGAAVGDKFENLKTFYTHDNQVKTPEQLNWLEKRAIKINPNANVRNVFFWNNRFNVHVRGEPFFAYCVSTKFDKDIMCKMSMENVEADNKPYDACVEIKDAWGFVNVLTNILQDYGFKYRGHGNCYYKGRLVHWTAPDDVPAWRLKDAVYAYQKECRIVLTPPQGYSVGRFMIYASEAIRDYCRLVQL